MIRVQSCSGETTRDALTDRSGTDPEPISSAPTSSLPSLDPRSFARIAIAALEARRLLLIARSHPRDQQAWLDTALAESHLEALLDAELMRLDAAR